jgi:hypothetical protein
MPRHRYMVAGTLTASIKAELVFREATEWPAFAHRVLRCARLGPERDFRQRAKNAANNSNPTMEIA